MNVAKTVLIMHAYASGFMQRGLPHTPISMTIMSTGTEYLHFVTQ